MTYTRGNDLSGSLQEAGGIGGLLARSEMSNLQSPHSYCHADGNGNITALVNTNGLLVARYHYDPFGNTLAAVGPLAEANLYRFSSKEWHPNSGLVYYLYRYYEPSLQRWVNRDPIGEVGGINLFCFALNGPTCFIDPFGLRIVVDPVCGENYQKARSYLDKSDTAKEIIKKLEDSPEEWTLVCNDKHKNQCNYKEKTIHWDPHSALLTGSDGTQSPALGLLHECAHAVVGENKEDEVMAIETKAAKELGEDTRKDHTDWKRLFKVDDPTKRGPVPPKAPPALPEPPSFPWPPVPRSEQPSR